EHSPKRFASRRRNEGERGQRVQTSRRSRNPRGFCTNQWVSRGCLTHAGGGLLCAEQWNYQVHICNWCGELTHPPNDFVSRGNEPNSRVIYRRRGTISERMARELAGRIDPA